MLPFSSASLVPFDANTQRALEQLAHTLNEVEQRIQLIRMSIPQTGTAWPSTMIPPTGFVPGIGQVPFGTGPNLASIASNPLLMHQVLATVANLHSLGNVPPTTGGVTPFTAGAGVSAPFGFPSPFQAPLMGFRY